MAWVTQHLIDVWNSGEYVGENTPHAVVQVQLGHWVMEWSDWADNPDRLGFEPHIGAQIWGEGLYGGTTAQPPQEGWWSGSWFETTPFYTVPNVVSIKRTKDLAQRGIAVLEVVVDALDYEQKTGPLSDAYHILVPGALAPDRNYVSPNRPDPGWELTSWAPAGQESRIQDSVRIRVWQGYGAPETAGGRTPPRDGGSNGAWTFAGMIDDVDIEGEPNQMTVTARNGKLLTDERVFRAAKSVQLRDPITFYDSKAAIDLKFVGSGATASSTADDDHKAKNVLDHNGSHWDLTTERYTTEWQSAGDIDGSDLEWVEIRVPQGNYTQIWLQTEPGLIAYVGIYAKPLHFRTSADDAITVDTDPPTLDGNALDEGWVGGTSAPGANGGWAYVTTVTTATTLPSSYNTVTGKCLDRINLGGAFELGQHSIIRVGLTRPHGAAAPAVVGDLHAINRVVDKEIRGQQFILVDDASDVVKVVLRWAGYHSWDVEQAHVRLSNGVNYGVGVGQVSSSGRLMFNRTQNLIEVIEEVAKQLGWIFFIADPVDGDNDGIPTFRRDSSLLTDSGYIAAELDDSNMLTGLRRKRTDEDKPYIIRVRGKTASVRGGGVGLGGDSVRRLTAGYHCPWSAGSRMGGILRHIVYQDDQLVTYAMCLYGCLRIAMQAALAMHVVTLEIPAHPLLELDDQVAVLDEPTATNSRVWIVKSEDTMQLGENPQWRQTLGGSLLDSRDLQEVIAQALGQQPMTVSAPASLGFSVVVDSINWNRVQNPYRVADGEASWSGYAAPILKSLRTGRIR